ncbi:class II histocompatibility antigen, B-L beta chain-like [Mastacembelus armatus]|uniref:Class II histocompatibility antigen, B-L beta chain-like n=1 Tax=Mastacembelus armatus TaxID=205130 RepID=A0A3Q3M0H2_9TELE|nr:class II histocompatibility antigen, B-L beta chain-like [Mastacembelus armatus]
MPCAHIFTVLLLFVVFSTAGGLYGHVLARCQFSSLDGHDAVYLEQLYFNKVLLGQYNSTAGKIIGYTKNGKKIADELNKNKDILHHMTWKTERCKNDIPLVSNALLNPVEPYIRLRSVKAPSSKHPGILICSVYNFYPKQIKLTWLRDGKKVTSDVTSTDELPNGNWLYQLHSNLEYTPRPGERITCMVEHTSLLQPKLHDWEPPSDPGTDKIAVGAAGLLLGLVFSVAGLIYYKKKSVHLSVPTTEELYPEHTL